MIPSDKKEFLEQFGKRVLEYRKKKGLSQEALANMIGYTSDNARSSINKIERGKSDLPASKIYALAGALGVPIGALMGWWDEFDCKIDTVKLEKEVSLMEKMKKSYGEKVSDVFFSFLKLDEADREETKNFIEYKLSNEKYSIQEESKNA